MIELVVFDIAGTTVHDGDAVNACFREALAAGGVGTNAAAVNQVMGLAKPEAIRLLLTEQGLPADDERVSSIHRHFVRRIRDHYAADPSIREVAGASAAFRELRAAGIKVALDTGFSRDIVDVLLQRLGWTVPEVLDACVTSDQVPQGRPHSDMIWHLMARLKVSEPANVVKVGDTPVDLQEGINAGCGIVLGVTSGSFSHEELMAYPHTAILASVAEVPALLLGGAPAS